MSRGGPQLTLPLGLPHTAEIDDFVPGPNAETLAAVRRVAAGARDQLLLHGAIGNGRSHLLLGAARFAAHGGRRSVYLCPTQSDHEPGMLDGVEALDLVCIDDIDAALPSRPWTLALLRTLDALHAAATPALVASSLPPEHLGDALPDLRTRLARLAVFGLQPLADDSRRELLQVHAHRCGLELSGEVADYLVRHLPRGSRSLVQAITTLDQASLQAKRRLTLPFVQQALGLGRHDPRP